MTHPSRLSRAPHPHETILTIEGLPPGAYTTMDGATRHFVSAQTNRAAKVRLNVENKGGRSVTVRPEPAAGPGSRTNQRTRLP